MTNALVSKQKNIMQQMQIDRREYVPSRYPCSSIEEEEEKDWQLTERKTSFTILTDNGRKYRKLYLISSISPCCQKNKIGGMVRSSAVHFQNTKYRSWCMMTSVYSSINHQPTDRPTAIQILLKIMQHLFFTIHQFWSQFHWLIDWLIDSIQFKLHY